MEVTKMKLSEIMTTQLITCSPDETLAQVARKLEEANIGSCPVVEGDRLVGLITDRDIATRAVAKGRDPNSTTVGEVMTRDLITGSPDMSIEEACELLSEHQIRRLPVVEGERLVGFVALADLAVDLEEEEMIAETLQKISMPSR